MADHPHEMTQNPAYGQSFTVVEEQQRKVTVARPMSVVVIDQQPAGESNWDEDRIGKSSKWDHHISLAVLVTVLSVFALNIFGLFCGVAGIFFAYKARIASQNEQYREKIENERSSFASVILCIIMWILTWCIAGFAVHAHYCGLTGASCETRTHI